MRIWAPRSVLYAAPTPTGQRDRLNRIGGPHIRPEVADNAAQPHLGAWIEFRRPASQRLRCGARLSTLTDVKL